MNHGNFSNTSKIVGWLIRLALGGTFLYLGAVKAADPIAFLKTLRQFDLIHQPLALNLVAAILPWLEILLGILLITGLALRGAAFLTLLSLLLFTAAIGHRGVRLAAETGQPFCSLEFDCGCGTGEVPVCPKLAQNMGLILGASFLLFTASPPAGRGVQTPQPAGEEEKQLP